MSATHQRPVVIVGGGVIGVCCAYYLSEKGLPVVVLEKNEIGSGCSFGNAGLLAASHSVPLASPDAIARAIRWMFSGDSPFAIRWRLDRKLLGWLWKFLRSSVTADIEKSTIQLLELTRASMLLYAEFAEQDDFAFGYQHRGLLELFVDSREFRKIQTAADNLRRIGLRIQTLGPQEARALEPMASGKVCGGLLYEEDCHIQPEKFVRGLAARARKQGAIFLEHTEAIGLRCENSRVAGADTAAGFFEASTVILAAATSSTDLVMKLGGKLPVIPGRGYSFTIPRESDWPERPLLLAEAKVVVTPMADTLRIGGTLELTEADAPPNNRRARAIAKKLGEYVRAPIDVGSTQPWSGDRPCSPDGLPIIGWSQRFSNLFYATGHAMLGITQGPITGKIAAQMLCGELKRGDPAPWAPDRFGNFV